MVADETYCFFPIVRSLSMTFSHLSCYVCMCLFQNLAYDADDTSSVWTAINVIEKERESKERIQIIYQRLLLKLMALLFI